MPVGNYPLLSKKNNKTSKIVVVNLQSTRIDDKADLIINAKLDLVFRILFEKHFKADIKMDDYYLKIKPNEHNEANQNKLTLNYSYVYTALPINTIKNSEIEELDEKKMIKSEAKFDQPHIVLVFSGKRKSGKDYVCNQLTDQLKSISETSIHLTTISLSAPLKQIYAQEHQLDYERLLDSSDYKEAFRLDMIKWSDSKREHNPFIFCDKAVDDALLKYCQNKFNIWIVTDARRKTDLKYFKEKFPSQIKTVRVMADEEVRVKRNWVFTEGTVKNNFYF
jgi:phosphomevalonate kinase